MTLSRLGREDLLAVVGGLLLALPKLSLGTVAVLCGIGFLVRGAVLVRAGLELRSQAGATRPVPAVTS